MEVSFLEPLETLKLEEVDDTPALQHAFKVITPANEYVLATHAYADKSALMNLIRDVQRTKLKQGIGACLFVCYVGILVFLRLSDTHLYVDAVSGANQPADEFSREMLVSKIIAWSKKDNAETVLRELREVAAQLERRRAASAGTL